MHDKKKSSSTIIIYSTPTCPYCHAAKDFFKENHLKFKDIDVSRDHAAAQTMIEKSKQMGVPVIDIDGTIFVGFDRPALKKALKLH